ncbi:antitoxin Xre/MbcA/ParS toxin-binding domain-containing protein [Microvirga sp. 2YAF29]|uniref:antitoxin Xre/MbcA/ParS toxin-binding domain-containing protein n=1 Tax=Microvirga sp. 2YAF29 TaxID=3233031 RepID=UPI003F95BBD8
MPGSPDPLVDSDVAIGMKAAARAAERLQVSDHVLGLILGLPEAMVPQIKDGAAPVDLTRHAVVPALLFVRVYQLLNTIVGGNEAAAASWFNSYNTALNARPVDAVQSVPGLGQIVEYLEVRRA